MGPRGPIVALCQPSPSLQSIDTMWSEKCTPKPGASKICARASVDVGAASGSLVKAKVVSATLAMLGSLISSTRRFKPGLNK
jgi:hypothetical protein